jgi:cytochrome c oxidase assembly factor CtaG
MRLSLDPTILVALAVAEALYVRAVRILERRGQRIPRWQQASWHFGIALEAIALMGPLDPLASDLLWAHMAQHLLLADIAVPFLLAGLRNPVLMFFLPRPVLVALARRRRLRSAFHTLRQPLVALPVFLLVLYGWHLSFAFEAALRHPVVHALQHESFALAALLVWWPALEPEHRRLGGELWKIPYVFASRMISMFLGTALIFMRTPAYAGFYGERARAHGLTPLADQRLGGGLMMTTDIVLMLAALCFFFWRAAVQDARDEERERAERAAGDVDAREGATAGVT